MCLKLSLKLIDALPEGGTAFLNMDNSYIAEKSINVKAVGYGTAGGEYKAENIRYSANGTSFSINGTEFETRLLGKHNIVNICAAVAVASELGIPLDRLVQPVRRLENAPHRLQLLGGGNRLIIDDAYNSNLRAQLQLWELRILTSAYLLHRHGGAWGEAGGAQQAAWG